MTSSYELVTSWLLDSRWHDATARLRGYVLIMKKQKRSRRGEERRRNGKNPRKVILFITKKHEIIIQPSPPILLAVTPCRCGVTDGEFPPASMYCSGVGVKARGESADVVVVVVGVSPLGGRSCDGVA